jgi:hypothetical protein
MVESVCGDTLFLNKGFDLERVVPVVSAQTQCKGFSADKQEKMAEDRVWLQ